MKFRIARLLVLAIAMSAFATPSSAQVFTGRIDVTAVDSTGAVLPGVTVDITGPENRSAVTDANGEAHFLNLAPGTYAVTARLQGFGDYTNRTVPVVAGAGVPLRVAMGVAGLTTAVEVTGAAPVIDPKKMTTSTNVTNEQLQEIPSSRDPWVVLQTVPGIVVDRVNVGGAESGQQSAYQAKGSAGSTNTWNIDGIAITDMSALGSSPTYYDFDMFQEMQVTTGGVDLQSATGGVGLNFVLKSGSNTPRGSTRIYFENEDMQANNMPADLVASIGGKTGKGNRIKEYMDYGLEVGGPLWRDRLWAWGAYGKTDITLLTLANTPDQTILDNRSLKITGQATQNLRANYTFFRGDKLKYGRGASPSRPPETTWDQSGPTTMQKGEANFVVSDNLFLTGRGAYVTGGFQLTPQGGLDTPWYIDDAGVSHGSIYHYETNRPQYSAAADGNYFLGNHEVKFGFGWRRADVDSLTILPGGGIATYHTGYPSMIADVYAGTPAASVTGRYMNAYIGDTITWDRLTLTAGVRWGRSAASVNSYTQAGNPSVPQYFPELTGTARENVLVFNAITPRIGVTYALDDSRRTIARASYSSFADQMSATAASFMSTVGGRGIYFYDVIDVNGNKIADPAELAGRTCTNSSPDCTPYGSINLANPSGVGEPIHSIGDYGTPMTHELQLGLDHELMTNFGLSGTFTFRHFNNFNWRNNGVVGTDYVQRGSFSGTHPAIGDFETPLWIANRVPANRAATTFRSRPDYSQRFVGFEAAATKRLSNRWMARLGFSTNRHTEHFDSLAGMTDPTPSPTSPNIDGGLVVTHTTSSGKVGIYQVLPTYQLVATGLYQAPWGINLAANMVSRQGYAKPYHWSPVVTADPLSRNKTVYLLDEAAEERLPNLTSIDVRVGKEFSFNAGNFRPRLNIDLDVFNVLNSATVLIREYNLRLTSGDTVREIMNPRVLRLGVRFNF